MKQFIFILISLIAFGNHSAGNEYVKKYENAKDYCVAKIVYNYLDTTLNIVKSIAIRDDILKSSIAIACILENMPNSYTSKIVTIEKGLA